MREWMHENLSQILNFQVDDDMIDYICQIQNDRDIDEYMKDLLDMTNGRHRQFVVELKKRRAFCNREVGYKKTNDSSNENKQNEKKKGKDSKDHKIVQGANIGANIEKVEKKKPKFVNLYSDEGKNRETPLLKGRYKCDCEAKRHALINNCTNCGRIVCKQEGAGPCFFCGKLVCSLKEQSILSSDTKKAGQLYNKLMSQKPNKNLEDSLKQRDKLLEYDRDVEQCTKIIDDECDYYKSSNVWLSAKQREKLQQLERELWEKKNLSHLNRKLKMTFDFAGREITEETPTVDFTDFSEKDLEDVSESFSQIEGSKICQDIEFNHPKYVTTNPSEFKSRKANDTLKSKNIVQDKELLEITDAGLCLSMHQPYASLLVAGIKCHEGRTWYSTHRGRLWIASASKTASKEDISQAEHFYRVLKDESLIFPESYPTSCLLGHVTVVDVLSQEEYRKCYPDGESDSPYVFICENFCKLPINIPVQGKHKIYKLDKKVHHIALKILEKVKS